MTRTEILLIQDSWKMLQQIDPAIIGDVFYSKLFLDAPEVKHLFRAPIPEQSRKLIKMLNLVITQLERLDDLKKEIGNMGARHQFYGVEAFHYDLVGNALIWTLQSALGEKWNESLCEAWVTCYTTLASAMMEGAEISLKQTTE